MQKNCGNCKYWKLAFCKNENCGEYYGSRRRSSDSCRQWSEDPYSDYYDDNEDDEDNDEDDGW